MKTITNRIRATFRNLARDRRGDGFLDLAFKILIIVVLGAAILLILNAAMPNLFSDLISKISGELTNVNVLP
jgi:ABC-type lipoprotein release transport system permease subunit